jgi:integrase
VKTVVLVMALYSVGFTLSGQAEDLCRILARPQDFAGRTISIRASVQPTMHGTYLKQAGCDDSVLLVLPEELPNYRGPVRVAKDAEFEAFLKARYDHRADAPRFIATFSGQLEYSKRGRFGNRDDLLLSEGQIRVHGKGDKTRFLPLAPEAIQLLDHYLRSERPHVPTDPLFVSLKGRARGARKLQ